MRESSSPRKNGQFVPTQYCPQGHNKDIVGRTSTKACRLCSLLKSRSTKVRKDVRERTWQSTGMKNTDGSLFDFTDYNFLYKEQEGFCKICGRHQTELKRALCADHNHITGIVRGLLCTYCNHAVSVVEGTRFKKIQQYLGEI